MEKCISHLQKFPVLRSQCWANLTEPKAPSGGRTLNGFDCRYYAAGFDRWTKRAWSLRPMSWNGIHFADQKREDWAGVSRRLRGACGNRAPTPFTLLQWRSRLTAKSACPFGICRVSVFFWGGVGGGCTLLCFFCLFAPFWICDSWLPPTYLQIDPFQRSSQETGGRPHFDIFLKMAHSNSPPLPVTFESHPGKAIWMTDMSDSVSRSSFDFFTSDLDRRQLPHNGHKYDWSSVGRDFFSSYLWSSRQCNHE